MGTWGANILENDTSAEIYEAFLEHYHNGFTLDDILKNIQDLEEQLTDRYNQYNAVSALCLVKWETGLLHKADIEHLERIIAAKEYLTVSKELEADADFLKGQEKYAKALLKKIKTPKARPKKRKNATPIPPPMPIDLPFKTGACLSFQTKDNKYGGIVVLEHEFFETKGEFVFTYTAIDQDQKPTMKDFKNTSFQHCTFYDDEDYYGLGEHYVADISGETIYYTSKGGRMKIEKMMEHAFDHIGYLPKFEHLRISSGTIFLDFVRKIDTIITTFKDGLERRVDYNRQERHQKVDDIYGVIPCPVALDDMAHAIRKRKAPKTGKYLKLPFNYLLKILKGKNPNPH